MMRVNFRDRAEAGYFLAGKLMHYAHRSDVIVLGLPRGGVPVAFEVAEVLDAPLDVLIVRKLGVPGEEELAMGAIAPGGIRILNNKLIHSLGISKEQLEVVTARETEELKRREQLYRGQKPPLNLQGWTGILVDDGLATGSSMWAAVVALRALEVAKIVVAVPVAAESTCAFFRHEVDEIVCGIMPEPLVAVGIWYEDFPQTTDEEVRQLLDRVPAP